MVLILSVATESTDGLKLFIKSLEYYKFKHKILGLGLKWNGGDMSNGPGGGQKINLLKEELNSWDISKQKSTVVLFTDSYDVVFAAPPEVILDNYNNFGIDTVLFSSEKSCWPNKDLSQDYPQTSSEYKYLNSGGFIGLAYNIINIINENCILDTDDDQLYFTKIFLSKKYNIKLDYECKIFQTLNCATSDINIDYFKKQVQNKICKTTPNVIHGNGPSCIKNYLLKKFSLFFNDDYYVFSI
jgi:hypothetical protein